MLTADYEFLRLYNKIDEWKMEAEYWEDKHNNLQKKYDKLLDESIHHSRIMSSNQLKLCLAISEGQLKQAFKE